MRTVVPARGTFHPKLYVGRRASRIGALITSANLTGGLISNVELGTLLRGREAEAPLADAWRAASELWELEAASSWSLMAAETSDEHFTPELGQLVRQAVATDSVVRTVSDARPNRITEVTRAGVWVETEASLRKRSPPQEVPAWMFELAWEHLRTHGRLTNRYLLATDGLNVKRSSAVCAILACSPTLRVASRHPIVLGLKSAVRPQS